MELSRPKVIAFWIAYILALLGSFASQEFLSPFSGYEFWLVVAGFVLLALGNVLKDLYMGGSLRNDWADSEQSAPS